MFDQNMSNDQSITNIDQYNLHDKSVTII